MARQVASARRAAINIAVATLRTSVVASTLSKNAFARALNDRRHQALAPQAGLGAHPAEEGVTKKT